MVEIGATLTQLWAHWSQLSQYPPHSLNVNRRDWNEQSLQSNGIEHVGSGSRGGQLEDEMLTTTYLPTYLHT